MTDGYTSHRVASDDVPGVALMLDVPAAWSVQAGGGTPALVAALPADGAGPFGDNLLVSIEALPTDTPLDQVQTTALAQALATVPDYLLLDDRPAAFGDVDGWFRASLQTADNSLAVSSRQLMAVTGGALVSVALTALPFRELRAAEIFDHVAASLVVQHEGEQR